MMKWVLDHPRSTQNHNTMRFELTEGLRQQYQNDGFFITPPLFDAGFVAEVAREMDRLWITETARTGGPLLDNHPKGDPGFMISPTLRSPVIAGIFRQEPVLDVWRQLLGGDADLNYEQIVMKQPETVANRHSYEFPFHQDNYYAMRGGDGNT